MDMSASDQPGAPRRRLLVLSVLAVCSVSLAVWSTGIGRPWRGQIAVVGSQRTMMDWIPLGLWVVDVRTGHRRCVARELGLNGTLCGEASLAWAPDGRRIAALCGDGQLAVIDSVTGATTRWTSLGGDVASPTWSPSGDEIAVSVCSDRRAWLGLISQPTATSGSPTSLGRWGGYVESPTWCWATDEIAFILDGEIRVLASDRATLTEIPTGASLEWPVECVVWSPTGDRLALIGRMRESCWLAVVDRAGGAPALLAEGVCPPVTWSPDGRWLAYERERRGIGRGRLVAYDLDMHRERGGLVRGWSGPALTDPAWAPAP